ncbi:acyl-CoA dehydrogenase family protein [Luedemannella helvata]|uniref:Dibenzothiophene monooxygenase n=1 Tax=Luedemannella helvata TaxID=349315 RepID=A0ABP4WQC1_9ACTN
MSTADLLAQAEEYLRKVRPGAAARERDRELPHALVRELAALKLGTLRVPRRFGGPGASVRETFGFLIALGEADSNIAQSVRPHFGFVESLLRSSSAADQRRWFPRVLAGDLFGLANGEIGAPNGVLRTRIRREGDHFVVNGSKYYSTGCLFADWLSVSAVGDGDERVSFVVPANRDGVRLVDDWDGMGQRLTASGTTDFADVVVRPDELLDRQVATGSRSHTTAFQQLVLAAVEVGIARAAYADAVWYARERSRPIKHSAATRSTEDPYIQHAVGEMAARAYAAEAAVLRAADAIDRALAGDDPAGDPRLLDLAAVEVAQAQFIAVEAALKNAELLFDVGGGSTTRREYNLDRHWRNARTVANHNPRAYKAGVVGAYRLNGTQPPTTGLF